MTACHACGADNPATSRFCGACGAALAAAPAGREERKVVTILFCDLVGFTSQFDLADPEDVSTTLARYHACVRREVERFGGTVEKFIGDAVMAVYGAPVAHEDDAQRALLSALRIPPAIEELNETNRDLPLAVRIGVETGEAVVTVESDIPGQNLAIGDVVNTASRLQAVAPTGGVVVGETTHRVTHDLFEFEPLEPVQVKGKAGALRVWRVKAARSRFGAEVHVRPWTEMVDREDELELLKRAFARAKRESSVQLVTLMGEPGIGKTRLVREFLSYLDDQPELAYWRQGRCIPYGEGVTFWALGDIVKAQAGILDTDDADEARGKLATAVGTLVKEPAEQDWIRSRLAPLIGLAEPQSTGVDRTEAFSAWRRFLEAMASVHPLVVVIEDLHWGDSALLEFVDHVVDWSVGYPILVGCTARPELFGRDPNWGGGKRNAITTSLPPLSEADTDRLISSFLPADTPAEVRELLIERAGGNPLFAEEFARMISDRSAASGEGQDAPPSSVWAPESLQAIIAARLDTLVAEHKTLLQDASVVGKVFWPGALSFIGGADDEAVREGLHELIRKDIVRRLKGSSVKDQAEYSFAHALIRDVAYGQIPRLARADKHIRVADWLERMAGERASDHAETLAHHYGIALELTRLAGNTDGLEGLEEATRRQWMTAGERAMAIDASRAEACFDKALALLPAGHAERAWTLSRKGEAAMDAGRYEAAERAYEEAIARFREAGDLVRVGWCLDRLAKVLWERGDTAGSRLRLSEAVTVLETEEPGPELAKCYSSIASERLVDGHFKEAVEWSERSLELAARVGADDLRPNALSYRGMARCYLGDLDGLHDLREALHAAQRLGLSREAARVHLILAEVRWAVESPIRALETVREGAELAERRGVVDMVLGCQTLSLGPLFDLGRWDELLGVAEDVVVRSRETGGDYAAMLAQPWSVQVLLWRGEAEQALELTSRFVAEALDLRDAQVIVPTAVAAGLVAVHLGRSDEARTLVEGLDQGTEISIDWYREQFLADLLRICVATGDLELAQRLLDRARAYAVRHQLAVLSGRAILDEARGRHAEAARGYEDAIEGWSRYGHQLETGMALLGAGRCLAGRDRDGSAERLRRARAVFVALDAGLLLLETDRLLDASGSR